MPKPRPHTKRRAAAPIADNASRLAACQREIEVALKKYNCQILSEVTIVGTQVQSRIAVRALDLAGPPP